MKVISNETLLVQQTLAQEEHVKYLEALLKTGKVLLQVPPDCYVWLGTEEELRNFMKSMD